MLDRLRRRDGDEQRARIGVADVLGREHDHAPRDEARVLAALQHRREVVHGRLRVAAAHRLDERRREVVVRVGGLVVDDRTLARGILDVLLGDRAVCRLVCELDDVQGRARVAAARRAIRSTISSERSRRARSAPRRTTTARSSCPSVSSSYSCVRESSAEFTS